MTRSFTQKYVLFLILTCLFYCPEIHAQFFPMNGQLYGEPINSTGQTYVDFPAGVSSDRQYTSFVTTSNHLYLLRGDESFGGGLSVFDAFDQGYYLGGWTVPAGGTIKAAKIKIQPGGNETILILLTNGNLFEAQVGRQPWGVNYAGSITDSISQSFFKIGGDDIYVLSSSHMYVTRDSGSSWQLDEAGITGNKYDFDVDTGQNVFMVGSAGLFKQSPTGNTWSLVSATYAGNSIHIDKRNRILVSGNFNSNLWLSPDDGQNWSIDTAGLNNLIVRRATSDVYGNLYVDAYNISTYPTHDKLFRSLGGTQPWQEIDSSLNRLIGGGPFTINAFTGDSVLCLGTNFGFFFSTDSGRTWGVNNRGIQAGTLTSLVRQNDGRLITSSPLGVYVIDATDSTWHKTYPTNGYEAQTLVYRDSSTGTIYMQDQGVPSPFLQASLLYKSTDNGDSWALDSVGMYPLKANNLYVDERGALHLSNSVYGSTQHPAIYTRNPGNIWTLDSAGIPWVTYGYINTMCSDRQGYLYASVTASGASQLMRRPVSGGMWVADTAGIGSVSVRHMASSPAAGMVAAGYSLLYHRSPAGSWSAMPLPAGLSSPSILAVSADSSGAIFMSCSDNNHGYGDGVYFTKDYGVNWTYAGLQDVYVNNLVSYGDTTYALSINSWAYKLTETAYNGISNEGTPILLNPVMAYPNPSASGIWNISIPAEWLGSKAEVTDINGRLVYSSTLDKIHSQIQLNAEGVYLLHVSGCAGNSTTKLIK